MLLNALINVSDPRMHMRFNVDLLYSEIGVICAVILLYLFIKIKSGIILIPNKSYIYYMIISLYAMIFTDNIWKWIEDGFIKVNNPLSYMINTTYFVALDVFIYFVIFYFRDSKIRQTHEETTINTSRLKFETKIIIGFIFVLHMLANMSAFMNKWFFYIDSNGKYVYGKYYLFEYIIPYTILGICVIELLFKSYVEYIHGIKASIYEKPGHIVLYQFISVIMGLIGFSVNDLPLFTVGMTLFLVAFYVRMVEYFVRIDPVTKLHTRRSILKILNDRCVDYRIELDPFTACLFVINNYYDLNELDGVAAPNNIIMVISDTFTEINEEFSKYKPEVCRLDGLRFLIIINTDDKKILEDYKKKLIDKFITIRKDIGEVEISLTYAYLRYYEKITSAEVLHTLEDRVNKYKEDGINTYII